MLRQRSRPYLFSNTVAPSIVCASISVLDILMESTELRDKLDNNTQYFRKEIQSIGYEIKEGVHPITPIMLYELHVVRLHSLMQLSELCQQVCFSFFSFN